jgi:hypothetical protein
MGCFSPVSVQRAAARACASIAQASAPACEMLLAADVGSMLEQHIKKSDTTLRMFEDASLIVAAIASHPSLVRRFQTATSSGVSLISALRGNACTYIEYSSRCI